MKLHERSLPQLVFLAAIERLRRLPELGARLWRTAQGVTFLGRSWRCAWILAERK